LACIRAVRGLRRSTPGFPPDRARLPSEHAWPSEGWRTVFRRIAPGLPVDRAWASVGRCKASVDRCRAPGGRCRGSVGRCRAPVGRWRAPVGRCRAPVGRCKASVGRCRASVGPCVGIRRTVRGPRTDVEVLPSDGAWASVGPCSASDGRCRASVGSCMGFGRIAQQAGPIARWTDRPVLCCVRIREQGGRAYAALGDLFTPRIFSFFQTFEPPRASVRA
jgi:hypothetical protein